MPMKRNDQEYVPMDVAKTQNQSEIPTTLAIVETTNKKIKQNERANWSNRVVYLLSIIGFVVDLGKIFQMKFYLKMLILFFRSS
jgi:hypothetical protein